VIALSAAATGALTRSYTYHVAVESWLGGDLLAASVPIDSATEEADRTLHVPERVTLSVPRLDRNTSWSPTTATHPLSANGQRLRVQLGIGLDGDRIEWFQRGWFVIQESATDGDTVNVTATGLLTLIDEARLVSPYQPTGTLVSTLRGLIEPALTVVVDGGLVDRSVPANINYDEDRLSAVMELIDAWPADAYVDAGGYLLVVPATQSATSVLALTDGVGGTVIQAAGNSTRDGAATAVVARGTAPDGTQVQGVAYATTGPKSAAGPFNPLPVPYFYASPLLTTVAQASAAADTVLARLQRSTSLEFRVDMVPHPGLQTGDVVTITTDDYPALLCSVEYLTLPYTPGGGAQTLRVRAIT